MTRSIPLFTVLSLVLGGVAYGQESDRQPAETEPVPEKERLVKEEAGQQVEEVRIQGRLESVTVTPRRGPQYVIEDRGLDGMASPPEGGDMESGFNIRTWKIGEW